MQDYYSIKNLKQQLEKIDDTNYNDFLKKYWYILSLTEKEQAVIDDNTKKNNVI